MAEELRDADDRLRDLDDLLDELLELRRRIRVVQVFAHDRKYLRSRELTFVKQVLSRPESGVDKELS
jgi:hypothetical protein